jgi:hypothetical protein
VRKIKKSIKSLLTIGGLSKFNANGQVLFPESSDKFHINKLIKKIKLKIKNAD